MIELFALIPLAWMGVGAVGVGSLMYWMEKR